MNDAETLLETRRFRVVRKSYTLPDGTPHVREIVEHPGAVVILPLLTDGRICLIRNYRVAVGQTLWELPAGTCEAGESPRQTAQRELAEETGLTAGKLEHLLDFFMSPGILRERMHLFAASDLSAAPRRLDAGEQIEVVHAAWTDALRMCQTGEIQDAKTLVGLLWYARFARTACGAADGNHGGLT